jgi:hypothetical protein
LKARLKRRAFLVLVSYGEQLCPKTQSVMKKVFLLFVLLPFFSFAQHSKLPEDFLTAPSALAILSSDENFEKLVPSMEDFLKKIGANRIATLHFSDNPTLRKKNEETLKKEVKDKGIKYALTLTVTRERTFDLYILMAAPSETLFDSNAGFYFIESKGSFESTIKAFEKTLNKNLKK